MADRLDRGVGDDVLVGPNAPRPCPTVEPEGIQRQFRAWGFTRREREVAEALLRGLSVAEIADELFIAEQTTKDHLYRVYRKAGVTPCRGWGPLRLYRVTHGLSPVERTVGHLADE